jgi:hypothetical protein
MSARRLISELVWILGAAASLFAPVLWSRSYWHSRRRVQQLAGSLLFRAVRPSVKRLELAIVLIYTTFIAGFLGFSVLDSASSSTPMPPLRLAIEAVSIVSVYAWLGVYWAGLRRTYVEFRERGVVCGPDFWAWENFQEWSWSDRGCVLRLKVSGRVNFYRFACEDKAVIQAVLEEHVWLPMHHSVGTQDGNGTQKEKVALCRPRMKG